MAAGLAIRKLPLGLPPAIMKHGGSILWALMVYWIVSTLRLAWTPRRSGVAAAIVTTLTELSQLYHLPTLDAFRATSSGALLLGRVFSMCDVFTYVVAVGLGITLDNIVRTWSGRRLGADHRRCSPVGISLPPSLRAAAYFLLGESITPAYRDRSRR